MEDTTVINKIKERLIAKKNEGKLSLQNYNMLVEDISSIVGEISSEKKNYKIPAVNFIGTMLANLDNKKLSDANFRKFIRNTMSIVEKPPLGGITNEEAKENVKKYYE